MTITTFSKPIPSIFEAEAVNIDELIDFSLNLCNDLPVSYQMQCQEITALKTRLSNGEIRLAVMGQFKRGKSTFVNSLIGIDLLPVSVIPVTSIPTYIRQGKTLVCTIRFFDKKPELIITESIPAIRDALTKFVSEQNNPKNKFCVQDVVIECNSAILANGTILIDTPGFGSTFIHNTTTTVELIKGCDAVLFLLSADPPFTQTEVEFLKEVRKYVPQIFFIVNKIDQLTVDELGKLDPFLKGILTSELSYPPDTTLYHVSARMGQQIENRSDNNPAMQISGMGVVKKEIIDFMVREKYFTLSQAVCEKFKAALADLITKCNSTIADIEAPLLETKKQHDWLLEHCDQIQKRGDREVLLIDAEIKALVEHVDKLLETKKQELLAKASETVRIIIANGLTQNANPLSSVKTAFTPLTDEMMTHLFLQLTQGVAKPLKRAIELPLLQFIRIAEEVRQAVPSVSFGSSEFKELKSDNELPPYGKAPTIDRSKAFDVVSSPFFDRFSAKASRQKRFEDKVIPIATTILTEQFDRLAVHVKNAIRSICDTCKQDLSGNFKLLNEKMKLAVETIETTTADSELIVRKELLAISEKRDAFIEIAKKVL